MWAAHTLILWYTATWQLNEIFPFLSSVGEWYFENFSTEHCWLNQNEWIYSRVVTVLVSSNTQSLLTSSSSKYDMSSTGGFQMGPIQVRYIGYDRSFLAL